MRTGPGASLRASLLAGALAIWRETGNAVGTARGLFGWAWCTRSCASASALGEAEAALAAAERPATEALSGEQAPPGSGQ